MRTSVVYIGIGSNQRNRRKNIERALALIQGREIFIDKKSSLYETSPLGPPQGKFLNGVVRCHTRLSAVNLLGALKSIELELGRIKTARWCPRPIDLDILFYGRRKARSKNLIIPHPRFAQRKFVLWPLKEIAPRFRPPGYSLTVTSIARKLTDSSQKVKLYKHG